MPINPSTTDSKKKHPAVVSAKRPMPDQAIANEPVTPPGKQGVPDSIKQEREKDRE